jgi:uncharacterized membrane protein YagU involved in acid resistance
MDVYNGKKTNTNRWFFALYIGFYAGLIWGAVKIIENYFHFTTIVPGFLVEPFFKHEFLMSWQGVLTGWAFFIVFSVIAAFVYMIVLSKVKGPWMGILYGAAWWGLLYLLIGPLAGMMYWVNKLDWNTIITDFCLFLLWGLFIGYTISLEFTDERNREPEPIIA